MDKTFMRFDVSTKKSDECMSVMQDSCKEELVIQREKEKEIRCVFELFWRYDFNLRKSKCIRREHLRL